MINRAGPLFNYGWGEDGTSSIREPASQMRRHGPPPSYQEYDEAGNTNQQEEYIDEETEVLNKKGRDDLNDVYENKQKFRDEIINFIGDETELVNEKILDKRYKHNTLNKLGKETLAKFAFSKDHARSLIGNIANYK